MCPMHALLILRGTTMDVDYRHKDSPCRHLSRSRRAIGGLLLSLSAGLALGCVPGHGILTDTLPMTTEDMDSTGSSSIGESSTSETSKTTSDGTTSDGTTSDGMTSDGTTSDGTTSDGTTSDGTTGGLPLGPCDGLDEEACNASDFSGADGSYCSWVRADLMSKSPNSCEWGSRADLCTQVVPITMESCPPAPKYPACPDPQWNAGTYWRETTGGAIAIAQLGCTKAPLTGWTACEGAGPDEPAECECWCFEP